ncbi:MAG: aspartate--tRNA ligase [Spirochaetia bacterium]
MKLERTHTCGELVIENLGNEIALNGWVENYRDHGGVAFIDLFDRWGTTQVVFDPQVAPDAHSLAHTLRSQDVIAVKGEVRARPEGTENPNITTGDIEVYVRDFEMLNPSLTPPFDIQRAQQVNLGTRLKYRYLDLRNRELQKSMIFRSRVTHLIRSFFIDKEFVEIETPILTRSTPEGARDFLVPSRINQGRFYALPQSPQLFKQSLMVSGFDRYFQIARCFRDEDLRADRQPEFTQVDLEMSFVNRDSIMKVLEELFKYLFKELLDKDLSLPIPRMSYQEAMRRYGTDTPDLRFGLEIEEVTDIFTESDFTVFKNAVTSGGCIRAVNIKGKSEELSKKELDDMTPFVKPFGGKGVAWIRMTEEGPQSPICKFFSQEESETLYRRMEAEPGDVLIFAADTEKIVCDALGALRNFFGKKLGLIDENIFSLSWIIDFPLFEKNEKGEPAPTHHPFTAPKPEDIDKLDEDLFAVRSNAYDLVLNGNEIGGGSIRIHNMETQQKIFSLLRIDEEQAQEKFGFLLEALQYGAPPHGGLALGLDRVIMLFLGKDTIRDVIAFPKTQHGHCPMTSSPNRVDEEQLEELGIELLDIEDED